MSNSLHPTAGARLLLELVHPTPHSLGGTAARPGDAGAFVPHTGTAAVATYRAAIFTATETFEGRAALSDDGSVTLEIAASSDYVEALEMLAKLTARSASKRRNDGLPPWPSRVLRWRGPGRGG